MRSHAEALPGISINYGWRLTDFVEGDGGVKARIARVEGEETRHVMARYLVGADGAHSYIRRRLGIGWTGETAVVRDFFGGRMHAIYLSASQFYERVPHRPAWMNVTFNRDRRAFMAAVDGRGEFAFHTQLRDDEDEKRISEADALAMFRSAVGSDIGATILSRGTWTAGHALVAQSFQRGRIFLGGDAAHLFTPAGGLGYNTAVEDAVNLGWKLADAIKGRAGPLLLDSYQLERRPVAVRNTGHARSFAESLGRLLPEPRLEDEGPVGEQLRRKAGEYLERHGRAEFDIPGITFGTRYTGSPIVVPDGSQAPPDAPNSYEPSATPGGRAPHVWLDDDRSLYDTFGVDWTLLRLGPTPRSADGLLRAARRLRIDLAIVDVPRNEARDLYEAPLALIRPDQMVAWRGFSDAHAETVLAVATGHSANGT